MIKKYFPLFLLSILPFLAACHKDEDNIFTTAVITLSTADSLTIERVQGTAHITDLNSKQVTTTSDFSGATLRLYLLRSSYSADIEGLVRYHDQQGQVYTKHMRAHSDYLALDLEDTNEATLNIIFLE